MSDNFCFASQGELIKFAFNAFGVLPRKHADLSELDETQKKNLQTQLTRLAKEQGRLLPNFEEVIQVLGNLLTTCLPCMEVIGAIHDCLVDLLDSYSGLVRVEGTFLNRQETLRYFISKHAIPVLVVSLNKSLLKYGLSGSALITPKDEFWYLPTVVEDGPIEFPLEKVMRWAYFCCGTSQVQFHYPEKNAKSENDKLQRNLESANKWTRGVSLPALPVLLHNFNESFRALAENGREVPKQLQISILFALTVARVVTYITKELVRIYDASYVVEVCNQFRDYASWIVDDINEFKTELEPVMQQIELPEKAFTTWLHACADYWSFFSRKLVAVAETMQCLLDARPGQPIRNDVIEALQSKYGRFAVCVHLDLAQRQMQFMPPAGFAEMLHRGFDLKNDASTQLKQIDEYADQLVAYGLDEPLCWMEPWLRAVFYYRQEDFQVAMKHFQTAFENAKYRAGKNQYKLVNQYIEVAAKNDHRIGFKKGVEWAQYLGVEIRWLRKDEPTEEKLAFVFSVMKKARYFQM